MISKEMTTRSFRFLVKRISSAKNYKFSSSDSRFEVINIKFKKMDILELSLNGHYRAKCIFKKDEQEEYWVVP